MMMEKLKETKKIKKEKNKMRKIKIKKMKIQTHTGTHTG